MNHRKRVVNEYSDTFIIITLIVSTMMLLRVSVFTLFVIVQVLGIGFIACYSHQLYLTKDKYVNLIYAVTILGTAFSMFSDMAISYKKAALYSAILLIPIYFMYSFSEEYLKKNIQIFSRIRKSIAFTCIIELILCPIQYISYRFLGIDLNHKIFVEILHLVESASQHKPGVGFLPSGLCWHSAYLAPIVILAFVFSKKLWVKGLALFDAVICDNATVLIGICACIGLELLVRLFIAIKNHDYRAKRNLLIFLLLAMALMIPIMIKMGIFHTVWGKIWHIYQRAVGAVDDGGSASAHIRYYIAYPQVVAISTVPQILFGYGMGCSGYPITELFGQYRGLKSWSVETDIMNLIYSRGLVGAICYYAFLIKIAIAGYRINYKYFVLIGSIFIAGITYNIQFDWLFLMELIIYLAVKYGYDFWEEDENARVK